MLHGGKDVSVLTWKEARVMYRRGRTSALPGCRINVRNARPSTTRNCQAGSCVIRPKCKEELRRCDPLHHSSSSLFPGCRWIIVSPAITWRGQSWAFSHADWGASSDAAVDWVEALCRVTLLLSSWRQEPSTPLLGEETTLDHSQLSRHRPSGYTHVARLRYVDGTPSSVEAAFYRVGQRRT